MKKCLIPLLLVFCFGCATYGKPLGMDKISQIKEGITTKQEVIGLLGNPNTDTLNGDGKELLMYIYTNYKTRPSTYIPVVGLMTGGGNMKQQSVQILVDKSGKVEKIISTDSSTLINSGLLNQ
jgi:outer membrane protein assembly factor BamE (lipoprotein component of BamABCDE complex)